MPDDREERRGTQNRYVDRRLEGETHARTRGPRGKRVAQAGRGVSFAICLTGGDAGRVATTWAGWLHNGEIANSGKIYQGDVESAFKMMATHLAPGDVVENIWVHGHGGKDGFLHAVAATGGKNEALNVGRSRAFVTGNPVAAAFHAFCNEDTKVHMYPCNAGKGGSTEALEAARILFCGDRLNGRACGPKFWYYLFFEHVFDTYTTKKALTAGCKHHFMTHAKTADQLEADLARFEAEIDRDRKCFTKEGAVADKKGARDSASETFHDKFFIPWFSHLNAAGLLPPAIRGKKLNRDQQITAMWDLVGQNWPSLTIGGRTVDAFLVMPFLSEKWLGLTLPRGTWAAAMKSRGLHFPEAGKWQAQFSSWPSGPGVDIDPC